MRLKNKIAIVTGAGSVGPGWGNGRATAVAFAREGARVLLVDIDEAAVRETAEFIRQENHACEVALADVTDTASVAAMVARCVALFGRVDILHNNVGGSIHGNVGDMSVEEFRAQLDYNLASAFITCKAVLPLMEAQGGGAIVNVGSVAGLRHLGAEHIGYSAAKAGLIQFSRQIAVGYGPKGIRCNTLIPGLIDTPLIEHRVAHQKGRGDLASLREGARRRVPLGRRGDAWDIAYAAVFLASDEAKYVTGTELLVDGGLLARGP